MASPAAAELVAHWPLNDGQVNPNSFTATDVVAPAANGTWENVSTPRWINGALGGAAEFGGSPTAVNTRDDVISISDDGSKLDITGALTISSWIKYEIVGTQASTRHIAGKDRAGGPSEDAYSLKHNMATADKDTLQFLIASNGVNTNVISTALLPDYTAASQLDGWVHVAGVFQPSEFMRLYINGVLDNELTGASVPTFIDSFPQTPFTIGRLHNSTSHSFNGRIDDVQVYGQALDATQIQTLFATPGTADTGLVSRWLLDDGQSDPHTLTAADAVSPASPGTWENVTPPRWTTGLVGGAAAFGDLADTSTQNDVITVLSNDEKLNLTSTLSIAAWIKRNEFGSPNSTRHIAGKDRSGGATDDAYSLKHNMTGGADTLQFLIASDGINVNVTSSTTLTDYTAASERNGWVHVAGVFEAGQAMRLYIDGALDSELVFPFVPPSVDLVPTLFTIGRLFNSATNSFNGGIDDVRLYDHALTLEEIQALVAMVPIGGLNGDHNGDGFVNAADYVFWRDTMGDVDGYNLWKQNFGLSAGSGTSSAVPEPRALVLFVVMALTMLIRRHL